MKKRTRKELRAILRTKPKDKWFFLTKRFKKRHIYLPKTAMDRLIKDLREFPKIKQSDTDDHAIDAIKYGLLTVRCEK